MKLKSIVLITALLTLITGCGLQSNKKSVISTSAQNTSGIFGGVNADSTFQQENGIVGLTMVMKSPLGYGLGTCSGTLIDKKVILTAAHCISGSNGMQVVAVAISFKTDIQEFQKNFFNLDEAGMNAAGVIFVDTVAAHPDYMKGIDPQNDPNYATKPWNDVALLRLSTDAPVNFKLAQLPTNTDIALFAKQSKLTLSGFGISTPIANEIVIDPKTGQAKVVSVEEKVPSAGILRRADDLVVTDIAAGNLEFTIESSQKGSCHGDSGGPAFLARADGTLFQVGVADRTSNQIGNCNEFMIYTGVIGQLGWITSATQQILAAVIPAPAPAPAQP